ncbi:hypothetical protein MA16_Dca008630 [Dendrobium catenatum]|uniref:Retrovirus-related Pol polyprotein from transposon TNT 1-94-like beta-barrel domain-containing protein n=1 Tax=Dendrobium catenatum TaxID=906689 RepID=A0A2I0WA89_9ASPA|nr:hypothetical protein MA16_Dca008630 [Dendrobium catenatum]
MWYLDSGCSRHMTGDANQFIVLETRTGGKLTLGDNTTRKVVGASIIGNSKNLLIENIFLVDGLKHNLLSISQLCDKGFIINFLANSCTMSLNNNIVFEGKRINNVYMLDLNNIECAALFYLKISIDDSWL